MSKETESSNWGVFSLASLKAGTGLNAMGTLYVFRNFDTNERFLFALCDLGLGASIGFKIKGKPLLKLIMNSKKFDKLASYTRIKANKPFSASDLNLAQGAEATAGITLFKKGCSTTLISAFPFFTESHEPNQEYNDDYFSGALIVSCGDDLGLDAKAAYQFFGKWIKLWSIDN